jgi:hypothetical protein
LNGELAGVNKVSGVSFDFLAPVIVDHASLFAVIVAFVGHSSLSAEIFAVPVNLSLKHD